jgi:hypothetical protein
MDVIYINILIYYMVCMGALVDIAGWVRTQEPEDYMGHQSLLYRIHPVTE